MIAYLDCTTGISGDKFLAALIDAGAPVEAVREAVAAIDPSVRIEVESVMRGGLSGLAVSVDAAAAPHSRTWAAVRALIESADLAEPVRQTALAIFTLLAKAEAEVHGVPVGEVHFHEVGAIDSIADVVGVAAALHALGIETLVCGPVSVGNGTVQTSHGTLPVPAPATALLLRGVPVAAGPLPGEATTPTGAALVRALVDSFGPMPAMTLAAVGHGAGQRDPAGVPNVARILLGAAPATDAAGAPAIEPVTELETTVDHLSAEHLAFCIEELLASGARDAWHTPALMKKGRAGAAVTVLCAPADETRLATLLAELTGTLGIRVRRISRYVVERQASSVDTTFGPVRVKVAGTGVWRRVRPEYEDLAAIARREELPVDVVAREVEAQARQALSSEDA
ncbi:MAG: nickel pincer cofactor biosynthesis protein LarC [Anaerosomatales bacterium]|nr:nickel pincer cofactor biosynthesis protein LarC [Anaerosomatales bacterium]MDT8433622.1 nickel pincer cofactor biosynthesis protein LarC [Anaerosomatales bacterium]